MSDNIDYYWWWDDDIWEYYSYVDEYCECGECYYLDSYDKFADHDDYLYDDDLSCPMCESTKITIHY